MLSKLSLYVLLTLCTVPIVGDWTKFAKLKVFFQLFFLVTTISFYSEEITGNVTLLTLLSQEERDKEKKQNVFFHQPSAEFCTGTDRV